MTKLTGHLFLIKQLFHNFYMFDHIMLMKSRSKILTYGKDALMLVAEECSLCCVFAACAFLPFFLLSFDYFL